MNRFTGRVTDIECVASLAIVEIALGQRRYTASLLSNAEQLAQWKVGDIVQCDFNENEVALGKNLSGYLSMRNRFPGEILSLEFGQLLTRVVFLMDHLQLSSVITTRSAINLELQVGDAIEGLVKSNEMRLIKLDGVEHA
jgi:molybdate transport system regulatory protein